MKEKFKLLKNKIYKNLNKIKTKVKFKKILDKSLEFLNNNKTYIFMFISLYILDISTRIATNSIGFYNYDKFEPNAFSFLWIFLIIFIVKNLKNIYGKLLYGLFFGFSFVMFLVHNLYYTYFKVFFDFSVLSATSEGSSYLLDTLKDISWWMYLVMVLSLGLSVLSFRYFNKNRKNNYKFIGVTVLIFFIIHALLPLKFGNATTELEWNAWQNKRNIYNNFNDNNKSMQLVGLFEYNIRNLYVNYLKEDDNTKEESLAFLETIFNNEPDHLNQYTGLFE